MQHCFFSLVIVLLTLTRCSAGEPQVDFYLATNGSDEWSGTLSEPNADLTDGPFATLERARDAVRKLKQQRQQNLSVLIRGGIYQLNKTVVFGLEDSGRENVLVTYAAYPGETPVFSSGQEILNWQQVTEALPGLPKIAVGKVFVADVPGCFRALFDSDGLLPRARSKGFIPSQDGSRNQFHFPPGIVKNWSNLTDVEVVVRPHHAWIVNILPLESVNENKRIGRTSINATYAMNSLHFLRDTKSCWIENTLEELDQPGEWVLNTQEKKLYLWPRNRSPVLAPQLTELIRIEGKIDTAGPEDLPVRNLCFQGLTFQHSDRYQITRDDAGLQHDWDMYDKNNALVRLRGTENCRIENCRFAHSGSGAIRVDLHGRQNTIAGNVIEQMGGTGILLCGYGPGTKDVNQNNVVQNNHIHHVGRIYSHSPGIMVWQSGNNRIANNLIHHTPYTALIISGCMTDFFTKRGRELSNTIRRNEVVGLPKKLQQKHVLPYLHTQDNLIEQNEIHHAMEQLGDGNGIYIRGAGAGNVIRRNYIHHLVAPMKMQSAIRTDGGQRDTLISENLIYKCTAQGIILKLNNRCENNIVADIIAQSRGYYLSLREGPMTGATIKRNIFYSTSEPCTFIDELQPGKRRPTEDRRGRTLAAAKQAKTDFNLYFCASNRELGQQMLRRQQADGIDTNSLAVDPLFVDPANGDFRLQPDSPALKLGFVPLDLSKVGLLTRKAELETVDDDRESLIWATRVMNRIDKNKNGTFEKSEDTAVWKLYRKLDANRDQVLSIEELRKERPAYLETDGERKLDQVYKETPQGKLLLDLYYPTKPGNIGAKQHPVIIYTHGGGWAAGSKQGIAKGSFAPVFQKLLAHGFAVASVNYRLCRQDGSTTIRDCVTDCKDAVRYLSKSSESLNLDLNRCFVMGDSAGGHLAQMLLLTSPESFPGEKTLTGEAYRMVAGVSWYGPCDFEKMDLFNHDDRENFHDRFAPRILGSGSDPAEKLARYREVSPVNYLKKNSPPLLMIQGDKDTTIPVKHAHYLKQLAETIGSPVDILIINNAGHNWRSVGAEIKPGREEIINRTVKFFVDQLPQKAENSSQ